MFVTRKIAALVVSATAVTTAALGVLAGVNVVHHSPASVYRGPSVTEVKELDAAKRESGSQCHLEWDGKKANQYEAICLPTPAQKACAKAAIKDQAVCEALYARKAASKVNSDGSTISDPAGPELVSECTSQYQGEELHYCLTQPDM